MDNLDQPITSSDPIFHLKRLLNWIYTGKGEVKKEQNWENPFRNYPPEKLANNK